MNGCDPEISVIVPCYNSVRFVGEALESLAGQTLKSFEVILINDGSTDGTQKRLEEFCETGRCNTVLIKQKNSGVSAARNRGIAVARGRWVSFLDADDIYHPEFLERMHKAAQGTDFSYCRHTRKLERLEKDFPKELPSVNQSTEEAMHKLLYEMGKYSFMCFLFKRDIIVNNDILFEEGTKYGEDREFNWKYLCHCKDAAWIDFPLCGYRKNPGSVCNSTQNMSWNRTDLLKAVIRTEAYLAENGCGYAEETGKYLFQRCVWAVAKTFARAKRKDLFKRLIREYDVCAGMAVTVRDKSLPVAVASRLYLINPMLFYYALSMV